MEKKLKKQKLGHSPTFFSPPRIFFLDSEILPASHSPLEDLPAP